VISESTEFQSTFKARFSDGKHDRQNPIGRKREHIEESRDISRLSASDPYPKVLYDPDPMIQELGWLIGIHDSKVKPSQ
jgi:hypothetical protein